MKTTVIDGVEYELRPLKPYLIEAGYGFEVFPHDASERMNWKTAMEFCEASGWRLPTRVELLLMYEQREEIGGFEDDFYWSSSEYILRDAFGQYFYSGAQGNHDKMYEGKVRAVRTAGITADMIDPAAVTCG
jgi:hypothetical protein